MNNNKIKTILFASLIAAMVIPLSVMGYAVAEEQIAEKTLVKDMIKEKMQDQTIKDKDTTSSYTSDEYGIPYSLVFEKNGKLVVGIDIEKTQEFSEDYSVEEVQSDLNTDQELEVAYYYFQREAGPTLTDVNGSSEIRKITGSTSWLNATITLVRNNNIITTGHLVSGTGSTVHMLCGGINICSGTVSTNPYSSPQIADAAIVTTTSKYLDLQENEIVYNGKSYSVTDGVSSDITFGKLVYMSGINRATSSGHILDTDVSAKDGNGILYNQVVANYPSSKGDSGAPVFEITGASTAKILGQHVGKFCKVDLHSGTNPTAQWCSNTLTGAAGALNVFTPWPSVKSNLGI